ncbi:MAG: hypothetical protein ACI4U2_01775, partial [Christensenellaceae bacterium]
GNDIVWDSVSDRFALVEAATGNAVFTDSETTLSTGVNLWKIYDEMPSTQTYSIYASRNWTAESVPDLKVGFDAGATTGINSVTYNGEASAKAVVIRTNSYDTEVVVNAPEDTVAHYGLAKNVTVQKVAGELYHEFGEIIGNIYLYYGHVVAESGAKAAAIEIKATAEQIGEAAFVIKADNTKEPSIPIIVPSAVMTAIESNANCSIVTPDNSSLISYESDAVAAIVGGETYTSLQAALAEVENNGTIVLLSDITGNSISLSKNFTLDLNGHTINTGKVAAGTNLFYFSENLDITIKNGTLKRETTYTSYQSDGGAIACVETSTQLELINTTLISPSINGYLITTNGNDTYANAKVEATNCDFIMYYNYNNNTSTCGTAIYLPAGNLILNDCNMLAPNCLVICGGSAKINGGTFVATSAHTAYQNTTYAGNSAAKNYMGNRSGCFAFGDAIQIQTYRSATAYKLSFVDIDNVTTVCLGNGEWGTYGIRVLDLGQTVSDAANQVTIGTITYQIAVQTAYTYDTSKSLEENIRQLTISTLNNSSNCGGLNRDPVRNS